MNEAQAAGLTDRFIGNILEHQANVVSPHALIDEDSARAAAKSIAAFRQQLIDELKKQP